MLWIYGLILFFLFLIFLFLGYISPNEIPAKTFIIVAGICLVVLAIEILSNGMSFPLGWSIG